MCNYLNNYDNLNGWLLHSAYIFMKNVHKKRNPYLTGKFSKLCSNKKRHYGFKTYSYPNIIIPLANWTIYFSIIKLKKCAFLQFNEGKKGGN